MFLHFNHITPSGNWLSLDISDFFVWLRLYLENIYETNTDVRARPQHCVGTLHRKNPRRHDPVFSPCNCFRTLNTLSIVIVWMIHCKSRRRHFHSSDKAHFTGPTVLRQNLSHQMAWIRYLCVLIGCTLFCKPPWLKWLFDQLLYFNTFERESLSKQ